jgi:hypothetical protein
MLNQLVIFKNKNNMNKKESTDFKNNKDKKIDTTDTIIIEIKKEEMKEKKEEVEIDLNTMINNNKIIEKNQEDRKNINLKIKNLFHNQKAHMKDQTNKELKNQSVNQL